MKKLVLAAAFVAFPVGGALAGEAGAEKAAAAGGVKAQVIEQPSWDTRQAGQGVDLKGGKAAKDADAK